MMNSIRRELKSAVFKGLTEKHRRVWEMRYCYRWRLTRIALEMGTSKQAVSSLLQRAQRCAGLSEPMRITVIRTQPRRIRLRSLSDIYNY